MRVIRVAALIHGMAITLTPAQRKEALASIEQLVREDLEHEITELESTMLLDFFLKEIGPVAYNQGVADAQRYIREKNEDLTGSVFEEEFGFWFDRERKS